MTLARVLLIPLVVGLLALAIGWLDISRGTSDTRWLAPAPPSTTVAAGKGADVPSAALDGATVADGGPLDGGGPVDGPVGQTDTDRTVERDEVYRQCLKWLIALVAGGTVLAAAWLGYAERLSRMLGGPTGYDRARNSWFLLLLLVILASAPASWIAYIDYELGHTMAADSFVYRAVLFGGLGVAIFWIATALGARPVMRPAIPFAGRLPTGRAS